jgi:hypothetical protein
MGKASALPVTVKKLLWVVFDKIFLFGIPNAYLSRFQDFDTASRAADLEIIDQWRKEQQAEWDRLSMTVR